jgi:two-component system, LuxR family, response regulator FixJ
MITGHIIVIDDDIAVLESLVSLLTLAGHRVTGFDSAAAFLREAPDLSAACLVTDIRLPDIDGLSLIQRLGSVGFRGVPVIVISGHADVAIAVSAMQLGATTVLEKPFAPTRLLEAISDAIAGASRSSTSAEIAVIRRHYDDLTDRERQVMGHLVAGSSSKVAAKALGISPRTVDVFRAKILHKMAAPNIAAVASRLAVAGLPLLDPSSSQTDP